MERASFIVQLVDKFGKPLLTGGAKVFALLVTELGQSYYPSIRDNEDGSYTGAYVTELAGLGELHIKLGTKPIAGSPFRVKLLGPDPLMSHAEGSGLHGAKAGVIAAFDVFVLTSERKPVRLPSNTSLVVAGVVCGQRAVEVRAVLCCFPLDSGSDNEVDPSSVEIRAAINEHEDDVGVYHVRYEPIHPGMLELSVLIQGVHILGSPFSVPISCGPAEARLCTAYGDGLRTAVAMENAYFVVETTDRFGNKLSLGGDTVNAELRSLDSTLPSDFVVANVVDQANGKYSVTFATRFWGSYLLIVYVNSKPILVDGWRVAVSGPEIVELVTDADAATAGVEHSFLLCLKTRAGRLIDLADFRRLAIKVVDVNVRNDSAENVQFTQSLSHRDLGTYQGQLVAFRAGMVALHVTLNSRPAPASPFMLSVCAGAAYAKRCYAFGPGISSACTWDASSFTVMMVDQFGNELATGGHSLESSISTHAGCFPVQVNDLQNGSYALQYHHPRGGTEICFLDVLLDGQHISGSPFKVSMKSVAEAIYSTAVGSGLESARAGEPASFLVTAMDSTGFAVDLASMADLSIAIVNSADDGDVVRRYLTANVHRSNAGCYSVQYTAELSGRCKIDVQIQGISLPASPYTVPIASGPVYPERCRVSGVGLDSGTLLEESMITIETFDRYGNHTMHEISSVELHGLTSGHEFQGEVGQTDVGAFTGRYTSRASGTCHLSVKVNGMHIRRIVPQAGSPRMNGTTLGPVSSFLCCAPSEYEHVVVRSPFEVPIAGPHAPSCIAAGVGLHKAISLQDTEFVVSTFTSDLRPVRCADPKTDLAVILSQGQCEIRGSLKAADTLEAAVPANRYKFQYIVPSGGIWTMKVQLYGQQIQQSPFLVKVDRDAAVSDSAGSETPAAVSDAAVSDISWDCLGRGREPSTITYIPTVDVVKHVVAVSALHCRAYGPGLHEGLALQTAHFTVELLDHFLHPIELAGALVEVCCIGPAAAQQSSMASLLGCCSRRLAEVIYADVVDLGNGKHDVAYTPQFDGQYEIDIKVNGDSIGGCPYLVDISGAAPAFCKAQGDGLHVVVAGELATFQIFIQTRRGIPVGLPSPQVLTAQIVRVSVRFP